MLQGAEVTDNIPATDERQSNEDSVVVQGLGRLNLTDNGQREWQIEAEAFLERHYPDWLDPIEVHMVPATFRYPARVDTGAKAEKKVYDLLRDYGTMYNERMFVIHSQNFRCLTENKEGKSTWVTGEHDFIIIHANYGLIFLQVKGSVTKGAAFKNAQKQIQKDKESTRKFLQKYFEGKLPRMSKNKLDKELFSFPGFVVMPNCRRPTSDTALDHSNGVFQEDCADTDSFHEWWQTNISKQKPLDREIHKQLLIRYVALEHQVPLVMACQIDHCYDRIVRFHTPQQLQRMMDTSPEQWITGPAGSGKTVLLVDKVMQLLQEIKADKRRRDERILILCFNTPLRVWFDSLAEIQDAGEVVRARTYECFLHAILDVPQKQEWGNDKRRFFAEKALQLSPPSPDKRYHHIFVDEAQDFYGRNWPEILKKYHAKPPVDDINCRYYFWVMYDSNQYVQLTSGNILSVDLLEHLRKSARLTQVLRNTENIFEVSKKYFASIYQEEITLGHKLVGLPIQWVDRIHEIDWEINSSSVAADCIHFLLFQQAVKACDIAILTAGKRKRDILQRGLKLNENISTVNAAEKISENITDCVTAESIRRFKGLESKVIILFDPPTCTCQDPALNNLLYTAVSRCLCYLMIVSTPRGCQMLRSRESCGHCDETETAKKTTLSVKLKTDC